MKHCKHCNKPFPGVEDWKKLCFDCWKRNKNIQPKETTGLVIEPDLLKRLVLLCHPDRHGQSSLSTEVTKTLLAMKKSLG
ncbi:MAG: hypothetical protein ACXWTK_07235 [Methylobacter sp.]